MALKLEKNLPLVTIRVPLYNHAEFVEQSLQSVANIDYPKKELIIIDDGSSDNSAQIVRDWLRIQRPQFPVIFIAREHKGLTSTLNELIQRASGSYLVSLASDDRLLPNGISKRIEYLKQNPTKMAVIGDCRVIDQNGDLLHTSGLRDLYKAKRIKYHTDDGILDEIVRNWAVPGSVLMVHRDIYEDIGYYDESLKLEDWDFYLRLASFKKIGFICEPVSEYRVHGNNTALNPNTKGENYYQMARTAQKNITVVPIGYAPLMIRKMMVFYLKAVYFTLRAAALQIFKPAKGSRK